MIRKIFVLVGRSAIICKGATVRYPGGGGAGKNFEINKFFLKNCEKNICTQAPCIYSISEYMKKYIYILVPLGHEINNSFVTENP